MAAGLRRNFAFICPHYRGDFKVTDSTGGGQQRCLPIQATSLRVTTQQST